MTKRETTKHRLSEYQRKLLVRLMRATIPHKNILRLGKRPVATILLLNALGYAECIHPDDASPCCCEPDMVEGDWQITDEGLLAIDA